MIYKGRESTWRDCPDPPDSDPAWEYTDADEEAEWLEEMEREEERLAEEEEDARLAKEAEEAEREDALRGSVA
jgi:hypothetical protein